MSDTTCTKHIYFCKVTRPIALSAAPKKLLRATPCRRGQTLIEILLVASIIVILGALSIDLFRTSAEEKIQGALRMFAQDAEWARGATLTNPDDPASIRLMQDQTGWIVPVTPHQPWPGFVVTVPPCVEFLVKECQKPRRGCDLSPQTRLKPKFNLIHLVA